MLVILAFVVPSSGSWRKSSLRLRSKIQICAHCSKQYINDLKVVGQDIQGLQLKYRFYLNRKLDLDESEQQHADQRSIRSDRYNGQTVLAITGNYYAAYPEKIAADQRARSTFLSVVMPILKSEVPASRQTSRYKAMPSKFPITSSETLWG